MSNNKRKTFGLLVGCFLAFISFTNCRNQPPSTPLVFGPQRARPNDTVQFSALSVDQEGDSISYLFNWSKGQKSAWSDWLPSGVEYYQQVAFSDTGDYFLQVKARDKKGESNWSDTNRLAIRFYQPLTPNKPSGPDTVTIGDTVAFTSSALHPLGESVSLQFNWSDGLSEWSNFVPPGTFVTKKHCYLNSGIYEVSCRARDKEGFISDWSLPKTVVVLSHIPIIRTWQ